MIYYQEVEDLTRELIGIPSMNNTTGESVIAGKIADYFRNLDYFKLHPEYLWEIPLKNDPYGRKNVFALIKGEKRPAVSKTVILHGHIDTVGIEDFGPLKEFAFDPETLALKLRDVELPAEVRQDLESGDWLFGRGSVDMKSGVAAHMVVVKAMSERIGDFAGNILFMANPVEENQHTGVMESLPFLKQLKESGGLDYFAAINNDYTAPLFTGDSKRYIYKGAVGKLLPCFYIVGKETHVGECFKGFDPNLVAAELLKLIDLNVELCDEYKGEYTLPPVALKCSDLKPSYNVQTPLAAFLYFNWFTHEQSVDQVLSILLQKAAQAVESVKSYRREQHEKYCRLTGELFKPVDFACRVISYHELYAKAIAERGPELQAEITRLVDKLQAQHTDTRIICLKVVELLAGTRKELEPMVVVFFAPPYCPHNTVKGLTAKERRLMDLVEEVAGETAAVSGEIFEIRQFFPCLSDSSYLTMDDSETSIDALINNFPEWNSIYPVPVREIRQAQIPAINFGVYGKDAHGWTERVYKPYSFGVLPQMTILALNKIFNA